MPISITDGAADGKKTETPRRTAHRNPPADDLEIDKLSNEERLVFSEIARALKTMRYGSIVLTVHDGRLVELSKTVRLRTNHAQ
jgi:hypothetical protein